MVNPKSYGRLRPKRGRKESSSRNKIDFPDLIGSKPRKQSKKDLFDSIPDLLGSSEKKKNKKGRSTRNKTYNQDISIPKIDIPDFSKMPDLFGSSKKKRKKNKLGRFEFIW